MREFKFRAWDKKYSKMLYHDEHDITFWRYDTYGYKDIGFSLYADEIIPMQYTGLIDKNGGKIYEEDIVYLPNTPNQYKCVVIYDEKQAKYKLSPIDIYFQNAGNGGWTGYDFSTKTMVVIGNIYENPELLS